MVQSLQGPGRVGGAASQTRGHRNPFAQVQVRRHLNPSRRLKAQGRPVHQILRPAGKVRVVAGHADGVSPRGHGQFIRQAQRLHHGHQVMVTVGPAPQHLQI